MSSSIGFLMKLRCEYTLVVYTHFPRGARQKLIYFWGNVATILPDGVSNAGSEDDGSRSQHTGSRYAAIFLGATSTSSADSSTVILVGAALGSGPLPRAAAKIRSRGCSGPSA